MDQHLRCIRPQEQLVLVHYQKIVVAYNPGNSLFEPPRSPIASCNFLFWPPLNVLAFAWIFLPKSQSLSNCSRSSFFSERSDHLTACHTRRVCIHVSSGNSTFFCGTIPMVPRGGRAAPPAKVIIPFVRSRRPPMIESEVDFPALQVINRMKQSWHCKLYYTPVWT